MRGTESESTSLPGAWLQEELDRRQRKNPRYSRRAFARMVGINSGHLSEILSGKREIGPRLAARMGAKLFSDPEARERWLTTVRTEGEKRRSRSKVTLLRKVDAVALDYHQLATEELALIAEPYHFAILNLLETDDFRPDAQWIAKRMKLAIDVTTAALDRLERVGLLDRTDPEWRRTSQKLTTTNNVSSATLRASHRKNLESAAASLESVKRELRDISSTYVPFAASRIGEARGLIENFRRSFAALMAEGPKDEVYLLSLAFFPLSDREGTES